MTGISTDEIATRITKELASTTFGCSVLTPLSGGTANFIFKGQLLKPLDDGTTEVVVKHGEGYSASSSSLKLSTDRCTLEHDCLKAAETRLPPASSDAYSVRTPKVYLYNPESSTQVQEYLPNALDLKTYALKHFSASTPASASHQIIEVGRGLGLWLRSFHAWAASQEPLRALARTNGEMQVIKLNYNYGLLLRRVDSFPNILADAKAVFEDVFAMAKAELGDEDKLQVIHGDFWTGK
ncbi:hypothetical protein N0V93_005051 [Gnomoniopsis smithogilvyi]|uniref:Aminoglycoside phosphotransferase domain-containing protein n=1 Tax=Gnomoniopsis smithogilvyi TaxID=1191159 RepID=A0A9W8YSK6_9PEZI|nr:hypothetical protein N0V93_005051 [Gnomoniopsis smithogilvyi]